jgi:putative transposase
VARAFHFEPLTTRCVECAHENAIAMRYTLEQLPLEPYTGAGSRSGSVWDNAAMESFFSSLMTERAGSKSYRTRDKARANVFDYIERFYNPRRRHSTIDYLSPMEFKKQA